MFPDVSTNAAPAPVAPPSPSTAPGGGAGPGAGSNGAPAPTAPSSTSTSSTLQELVASALAKAAPEAPQAPPAAQETAPVVATPGTETGAAPVAPQPETQAQLDFASVRTERDTLKGKLDEMTAWRTQNEPLVAKYQEVGTLAEQLTDRGAQRFLEVFEPLITANLNGLDDPRGRTIGAQVLDQLAQYDPAWEHNLVQGVSEKYKVELADWAMSSYGMTTNDIRDYQEWKAGHITQPVFSLDRFPPIPDDGVAYVPHIDGDNPMEFMEIDTTTRDGMLAYNSAKRNFELTIQAAKNQRAEQDRVATEASTREASQKAAFVQQQKARQDGWMNEHQNKVLASFNSAKPQAPLPDDLKILDRAMVGLAQFNMSQNKKYQELVAEGLRSAGSNAGRAADLRQQADTLAANEIKAATEGLGALVKLITDLRASIQTGAPVIPAAAPALAPGFTVSASPQPQIQQPIATSPATGEDDGLEPHQRVLRANMAAWKAGPGARV